ncbi:MAG: MBL fold metallo-hydrolase, partial [Clostridia bacterium]|nr:MBL fold metallo-hydrolase [Clostridia bacterium]
LTVRSVLLTHGHFDHIVGLEELYGLTKADVYIHEGDLPMLSDVYLNLSTAISGREIKADVPVKTLSGGEALTFGEETFTVLHTPGHSPGSVCYVSGDTVFTGDTVFSVGYGRTDFPGSSFLQLRNSIRLLKSTICGKTIYPGHGETKIY